MQSKRKYLLALLLLLVQSMPASAADVVIKVIDGLGRPVAGADVKIYWLKTVAKGDVQEASLLAQVSDANGMIKGTYDETTVPPDETIWVELSKEGYSGYSSTDLLPEYVLKREFGPADVRRIALLDEKAQIQELRELLAGDPEGFAESFDLFFTQEHRFRPALRALIPDAKVGVTAGQILAFIGVPEDVRLILDHAPPPHEDFFENRWAYGVVSTLLEPTTEKEWAFLRNAALNQYDDPWVDAGAIQALRLIASPRSLQMLREVKTVNRERAEYVESAIRYIESTPPSLSDEDLVAAGKKVADAVRIGNWKVNREPRFNEAKDKVLVDCQFVAERDLLVYTATFHKVEGRWKLRGVRLTMQALLATPEG